MLKNAKPEYNYKDIQKTSEFPTSEKIDQIIKNDIFKAKKNGKSNAKGGKENKKVVNVA